MSDGVIGRVDRMEKKLDRVVDGLYGDEHRPGFIDTIIENQQAIRRNQEGLKTIERFIRLEMERREIRRKTSLVSALLTPLFVGAFVWMLTVKIGITENQAEAAVVTGVLFFLAVAIIALFVMSAESLFR